LSPDGVTPPSSHGEYKVTRGRYYTVSGKSPQLVGVHSDIVVPGTLCFTEIGEQYLKFPLPSDNISAHFIDDMEDLPFFQRSLVRRIYATDEQKQTDQWTVHIPELKKRTEDRMIENEPFQQFIGQLKNHASDFDDNQKEVDYQLDEAWNIMEDLTTLSEEQNMEPAEAA
jgi:carboxyl-terminal processing protease